MNGKQKYSNFNTERKTISKRKTTTEKIKIKPKNIKK
jgi:hypothetical protein